MTKQKALLVPFPRFFAEVLPGIYCVPAHVMSYGDYHYVTDSKIEHRLYRTTSETIEGYKNLIAKVIALAECTEREALAVLSNHSFWSTLNDRVSKKEVDFI